MEINLADAFAPSFANGPGARAVLAVQGCLRRCSGCHNAHMWSHAPARICEVGAVLSWLRAQPGLRGLTLTGGEPFEQAEALARVARAVRADGWDVVCFTGYSLEELRAGQVRGSRALVRDVDLLIHGPFDRTQASTRPLLGSVNQRLHFQGNRVTPEELLDLPRGEWAGGEGGGHIAGFLVGPMTAWLGRSRPDGESS